MEVKPSYSPKPETLEKLTTYQEVSRIRQAMYGVDLKTDERFKGMTVIEAMGKVLDNEDLKTEFLEANEAYKESNTLAQHFFTQFKRTGRTPRELSVQSKEVQELYEKKLNQFKDKFGL